MTKKLLLSWDTFDIIKQQVEYLREDSEMSDDELFEEAAGDRDLFEWSWEDLCDCLTALIKERNPEGEWHIEADNFGWRELSGSKECCATTGKELLREILPKTDCTFNIYDDGAGGFAIQNFHHDSPTGHEWYYVYPKENDAISLRCDG